MATYELSGLADGDLTEIYVYSNRDSERQQLDAYLLGLHNCFALLAEHPTMGRCVDHLRAGYLRFEHARYTIFYVNVDRGIRIMRLLHERMDPERHL